MTASERWRSKPKEVYEKDLELLKSAMNLHDNLLNNYRMILCLPGSAQRLHDFFTQNKQRILAIVKVYDDLCPEWRTK